MNKQTLGLYLHIPFCVQKCRYCDFLSFDHANDTAMELYASKLAFEIGVRGAAYPKNNLVDSIYIGGGTPSVLRTDFIEHLLDAVYACFHVSDHAEITIECNPGTVTPEKLSAYRSFGINRISMGCQSFDKRKLKYLGRIHSSEDIFQSYKLCRKAGFDNVNLDLIFGVPGESPESWMKDILNATMLQPEHISFYSLQVEAGTPIYDDIDSDRVAAVDEISDRKMYHAAVDALTSSGYHHYEISNAAKPGFESKHNLKYWSMEEYLGMGIGAHSYLNGLRFSNTESLEAYLAAENIDEMTFWVHANTEQDTISEYIFLGLRKTEGISLPSFSRQFGKDFWELFSEETNELIGRGLLEQKGERLKLTPIGLDLSNIVFAEYV